MSFVALLASDASAQTLRGRMLAAEDARAAEESAIAPLVEGLRSADPTLVQQAVRALGRFERLEFVPRVLPLLASQRPEVRREAANALGQLLVRARREDPERPELMTVTLALLARLRVEPDPATRGVIAETVGRLPHRTAAAVGEVEGSLQAMIANPETQPTAVLRGALRGLDWLVRGNQKLKPLDAATNERVRAVAMLTAAPSDADRAGARRDAWFVVLAAASADLALIARGLDDTDAQVRRLAITAVGATEAPDAQKRPLLDRALGDPSFNVRYDAVRAYARTLQPVDCVPLLRAADDRDPQVSLAAIDMLGAGCAGGPSPVAQLTAIADRLPGVAGAWHRPAHAFVSLARVGRDAASARLAVFAGHPVWQVRMYAARGAAALGDGARLEQLARDANDNVREAAIAGLRQVRGRDADRVFIDALARPDYQLILTAAQALEGSPLRDEVTAAALTAFARLMAEQRDTSRDSRLALLARIRELGSPATAPRLQSCLRDADPAVADFCAETLRGWTGAAAVAASPRRVPRAPAEPLPTQARLTLSGGRVMDLTLFPDVAPFTVERFATLARRGYYDGLTFHRVVTNFVLQGGSPGANEYSGDGSFMRDELGLLSNRRGTIGTSTRGRDTGDAQIFVNLLDNPRLDHDFTVFAEIRRGLDVMDAILEGDVIERVDVLR